jgi:CBS-domain-containing membrane protein
MSPRARLEQNLIRYRQHRLYKALIIGGAIAAMASLADALGPMFGATLFVPPLAASLFLVIAFPEAEMAQPRAVLGGQVLCAVLSISVMQWLPWPSMVVATSFFLSIVSMILTRTVHAPAAATIYFVIMTEASWNVVITPIALGSLLVIAIACLVNKLRGEKYPRHWL